MMPTSTCQILNVLSCIETFTILCGEVDEHLRSFKNTYFVITMQATTVFLPRVT